MNSITKDELKIVEDSIILRLDPFIYAFSTNTIPSYLKIGDTTKGVDNRIDQWRKILNERLAPQKVTLKEEYRHPAVVNPTATDDKKIYFRDYEVHKYLKESLGKKSISDTEPNLLKFYSNEFFKNVSVEELEDAIDEIIKDGNLEGITRRFKYHYIKDSNLAIPHLNNSEDWKLRPNQEAVVNNFMNKKDKKELLMYAVMRFGKSFTAMQCALKDNRDKVIIVSAKADVLGEWKKTIEGPKCFKDYAFICDDDLKSGKSLDQIIKDNNKTKMAVFLTLQNLSGKSSDGVNIKKRLEEIYNNVTFDLLIIDETHYGAWANVYKKPISDDEDNGTIKELKNEIIKTDEVLNARIHAKQKLHLSGTPYNLLYEEKFDEKNIIATIQFKDILDAKEKWNEEHFIDIENGKLNEETKLPYQESDNPYFGFPQMLRFAFNLPDKWIKKILSYKNDIKWSLTDLFLTKKENNNDVFVFENEVLNFLKTIDGSNEEDGILSFLDVPKIKNNDVCKHIVMVLPYRSSCDAMEKLLSDNRNKFINLCNYKGLINIAGRNSPNKYNDIENIKNDITNFEKNGTKTISLTVHRMLTGVTVKEWDTMIMLKNTKSAQEYDQAIFRIQNQYIKEYIGEDGSIYKKDMKPQTILVDFDPVRFFEVQGLSTRIVDKITDGDSKLEDSIVNELKYFPIITYNANKIVKVDANNLVEIITKYNSEKSIMDETSSINLDDSLLSSDYLAKYINKQSEVNFSNGLKIKAVKGEEESEFDSPEISSGEDSNSFSTSNKNKKDLLKKYRMCIARILFYSFLTKTDVEKMKDILDSLKDNNKVDNNRIFKNLNIDRKFIVEHIKKSSRNHAFSIDNSIKKANLLSKDEKLSEEERAINALNRFSKITDSEIVTPTNICDKVIGIIGINELARFISNGGKILDIASKTGEFAFCIFKSLVNKVDINVLKNSIYSIPTSNITYEFTRKTYESLGLSIDCISKSMCSFDLIIKDLDIEKFFKDFFTDRYKILKQKGDKMNFDVVIGNPPYQDGRKNIFPAFQIVTDKIRPKVSSLIFPAKRWIHQSGKGCEKFGNQLINDKQLTELYYYPNSKEVFTNVDVSDGISIVVKKNDSESADFTYHYIESNKDTTIVQKKPGKELLILCPKDINLVSKIRKFVKNNNIKFLSDNDFDQKFYGIESDFVEKNPSKVKIYKEGLKLSENEIILYTNDKAGSSGRIQLYITDRKYIKKNIEFIDKYQIIVSSAHPGGQENRDNQLEMIGQKMAFGRARIQLKSFDNYTEANNFYKYAKSKFFRYCLLLSDEAITSLGRFVPDFINYGTNSIINFEKDVDEEIIRVLNLTKDDVALIDSYIK